MKLIGYYIDKLSMTLINNRLQMKKSVSFETSEAPFWCLKTINKCTKPCHSPVFYSPYIFASH